ncbi:hypothetical protein GCM10023080_085750 [Streptomyces pseudoechinosporeus]
MPTADLRTTTADNPALARKDAPAPVAASHAIPAWGTARVDDHEHQEQQPEPSAGPVKDWDLPADCAPGRAPELLTDEQAHARIVYYALTRTDWTQRRIGGFAGRSATTVNKVKKALE